MTETFGRLANDVTLKTLEKPGRTGLFILEKAFRGWEDHALMAAVNAKLLDITAGVVDWRAEKDGVAKNFSSARRFILEQGSSLGPVHGLENFIVNETQKVAERVATELALRKKGEPVTDEALIGPLQQIDNYFLSQILAWTRDSRRVISLDRESVLLHAQNTYDDFTWNDILMPFQSFMIELQGVALTITGSGGQKMAISGILVTHINNVEPQLSGEDSFECRVFVSDLSEREPGVQPLFTSLMRKHAEQIVAGNPENINEYIDEEKDRFEGTKKYYPPTGFAFQVNLSDPITSESLHDQTNIVQKIIAGTCLYLAHTPGKEMGTEDIRGETWHRVIGIQKKIPKKITPQNLIHDEAQILTIKNVHEFDPRIGKVRYTDQTGRNVEVHARRAHLRRKPRTPIDTEKTVKVSSTWIHREQLPRDALPAGAITILRSSLNSN